MLSTDVIARITGPADVKIVLRAALIVRNSGGIIAERRIGYFRSHSRNPSSVFGIILHLLFILDPRRSLRLSDLCGTYLSSILEVSLASFPLVASSHCQIALDKLTFLSLRFLGFCRVMSLAFCLVFSFCSPCSHCLVQLLYPLPGPLWSPFSHLFPSDLPTQSTAAVTATPT